MRGTFALLAIVLTVAIFLPAAGTVRAQAIFGSIDGPSALAPGQKADYNVTLSGEAVGPGVEYSLEYYITGPDPSGGSPLPSSAGHASGNNTVLRVNITAPQKDQTITLVVKITARAGTATENGTVESRIEIVTPILLTATFHNAASTAALNVTVRFYVDSRLVGTQKVARISANADATVTYDWLPVGIQPGTHSVRVEADLDGNGRIDPSRGEVVASDFFFRESAVTSSGWTILLAAAIFVPVLLGTIAVRRRGQR